MVNINKEQYLKAYKNAPPDVRYLMGSLDTGKLILAIGKRYNLSEENVGILSDEIGMILLGFEHEKDFSGNIQKGMMIDKKTADMIANKIKGELFQKVDGVLHPSSLVKNGRVEKVRPAEKHAVGVNDINKQTASPDVQTLVLDFIKKYNIHFDQAGIIEELIQKTIDGEIPSRELASKIKKGADLSDKQSSSIIQDINEQIFKKIRRSYEAQGGSKKEAVSAVSNIPASGYREPIPEKDKLQQDVQKTQGAANAVGSSVPQAPKFKPLDELYADNDAKGEQGGKVEAKLEIEGVSEGGSTPVLVKDLVHKDSADIDIAQKKLGGSFTVKKKETERGTSKEEKQALRSSNDPYREPVN